MREEGEGNKGEREGNEGERELEGGRRESGREEKVRVKLWVVTADIIVQNSTKLRY